MASVSVTFDGTRLDPAEAIADFYEFAALTKNASQEPDVVWSGTYSMSHQVKAAQDGVAYVPGSTSDLSTTSKFVIFKHCATNYGVMGDTAGRVYIGSSSSAYYSWQVTGGSTYPVSGGWLVTPIDPNLALSSRETTGSPDLTAVDFIAWATLFSAAAKIENVMLDAVDICEVGKGLTLVGGDTADTDGDFADFIDKDEGGDTNRWGILITKEGILYINGVLSIGDTGDATGFTDSNKVLVFPDGYFGAGFCGMNFELNQPDTDINLTSCTFVGRGSLGAGDTYDTRPNINVSGDSGTLTLTACSIQNFNDITLNARTTITDCTFINSDYIYAGDTDDVATFSGCVFDSPTTTSNIAFIKTTSLKEFSACSFIAGDSGHALEITKSGTYDFINNSFSGYALQTGDSNDRAILNNSGDSVRINVSGSQATTPTYKNTGAGDTTYIVSSVSIKIQVIDEAGDTVPNPSCAMYLSTGDSVFNIDAGADGYVDTTYGGATPSAVTLKVRKSSPGNTRYFPNTSSGTITSDGFSSTVTLIQDKISS